MSAAEMIMTDSTDEFGPGPPIESLRWLGAEDDPAGRTWHRPDDAAVRELREKMEANLTSYTAQNEKLRLMQQCLSLGFHCLG